MPDAIQQVRERQAETDARIAGLEKATADLREEVTRLARLLRGNGKDGLVGDIQLLRERVDVLQSQWKWVVGILAAIAVGVAQALLRR